MFAGKNVFVTEKTKKHARRPSEFDRAIHKVFAPPKPKFENPRVEVVWQRFYWGLRTAQFKVFYKDEETDLDSISDLLKYEPSTKPPTMNELMEATNNQFSKKWIKYIYCSFKSECPSGRMKLEDFKRLFSYYLPDRVSDAYLDRLFKAICYNSIMKDTITFRDLLDSLAMLHSNDPKLNAQWTMRLINPRYADRITFNEFHEFVQSVFLLVGRERRVRVDSCLSDYKMDNSLAVVIKKRARFIFTQMDPSNRGYITLKDLEFRDVSIMTIFSSQ